MKVLFIDWYIGMAYLLQALIILDSCIVSLNEDMPIETIEVIDHCFAIILGSLWIIVSLFYLSLKYAIFRDRYEKICCDCCTGGRINYNDWQERADKELTAWKKDQKEIYKVEKIIGESDQVIKNQVIKSQIIRKQIVKVGFYNMAIILYL